MQEQTRIAPDTRTLPVPVTTGCTDHCAWGLKERGIKPVSGSHGICLFHKAQMLAQVARLRGIRTAQRQAKAAAATKEGAPA